MFSRVLACPINTAKSPVSKSNISDVSPSEINSQTLKMKVFGYGSLIYKTDVPVVNKEIVCIKGWRRVFFQGSTDHRGTVEKPGRVCTLLPDKDSVCWGIVFTLDPLHIKESIEKLDFRERNGYSVESLEVFTHQADTEPLYTQVLTYIAKPDNEVYLGDAPIDLIAKQVVDCSGHSGKNSCYVLKLAQAVRELMPHVEDDHLFSLERAILGLL